MVLLGSSIVHDCAHFPPNCIIFPEEESAAALLRLLACVEPFALIRTFFLDLKMGSWEPRVAIACYLLNEEGLDCG
jgi:hypothetical protein